MNSAIANSSVKNFFVDVSTFYNHYHDLFSEDITGAPFLEDITRSRTLPLARPIWQRLVRSNEGFRDLARMATHIHLATARRVFLPANEHQ